MLFIKGVNLKEGEKVGACPVLVGHDQRSSSIWTMPVDQNGAVDSSVRFMLEKLGQSGYLE